MISAGVDLIAVIVSLSVTLGWVLRERYDFYRNMQISIIKSPCPHGYDDWDDCPDCRH